MKVFVALLVMFTGVAHAQSQKTLSVDDLLAMQRVSDPSLSPDKTWVVFTVRDTDYAANRGRTDVWIARTDGSGAQKLTTHPEGDSDARFSRDGAWVYFLSTRSESSQVWRIRPNGGEAEQVTKLPIDVNGFKLFPTNDNLLLALDVYPAEKTLADTAAKDEATSKSKSRAVAYDNLLFRHWDQFEDGKRSHLFVWDAKKPDTALDLTPGLQADTPTRPFGGMEEADISPDGKWLVYAARQLGNEAAIGTNVDLYMVSTDGKGKAQNITAANKAWDSVPMFSPDGKQVAYLAMARPQYESDRTRIALYDVAKKTSRMLTETWDRSPGSLEWTADGKSLLTHADHVGANGLFRIDANDGAVAVLASKFTNIAPQAMGDRVLFVRNSFTSPSELYTARMDGSDVKQITFINSERVRGIAWSEYEQFSFSGAKGDAVYGYIVKPKAAKSGKVPVALMIHGGPQGSFTDNFHYRWNSQIYAAQGFGVVMIDFHGSTGYGQAFTDAIRGDWGGAPYEDLMKGLDAALAKYNWLDGKRAVALGASYGGYMINWINGNTDRFRALVCHDGNIDEQMAYFDTEELWFPEWEHQGAPWENPESYQKHNPINLVKNWKTPTLVIHGGKDFRVVDTQGMSTFTALQRKGVPSRFLYFPDENHWVLKPQNSKRWHDEVLAWIGKWAR